MKCPECSYDFGEIVVPDWYETLASIGRVPGHEHCDAWLEEKGISEETAEDTAIALKAKWGGKGWRYSDPWATFQSWCRMSVKRENGTAPDRRRYGQSREYQRG